MKEGVISAMKYYKNLYMSQWTPITTIIKKINNKIKGNSQKKTLGRHTILVY
jgi:hypothetical protein